MNVSNKIWAYLFLRAATLILLPTALILGCSDKSEYYSLNFSELLRGLEEEFPPNKVVVRSGRYSSSPTFNGESEDDLGKLIEIFNDSDEVSKKKIAFHAIINIYEQAEDQYSEYFYDFLYKLASSDEYYFSSIAFEVLVRKIALDNPSVWSTWDWPDEIKIIFAEAVEENLGKLSDISDSLTLLSLFKRFPKSKLTGCSIYLRNILGRESYISPNNLDSISAPIGQRGSIRKLNSFLQICFGHPGSNDAMYRIARTYEIRGDFVRAAAYYYKSGSTPDSRIYSSYPRMLHIIDLLLDSKSVDDFRSEAEKLDRNYPSEQQVDLAGIVNYSRAIHHLRAGNIKQGIQGIKDFSNDYKDRIFQGIYGFSNFSLEINETSTIYPDSKFWHTLKRQVTNLERLEEIREMEESDKKEYELISFWNRNELTFYNFMWRGSQNINSLDFTGNYDYGLPKYNLRIRREKLISQEFHDISNQNLLANDGYQKSLALCLSFSEKYPQSELREKAEYSIILNYYLLKRYGNAIEASKRFVKNFPDSSLADDALITLLYLTGNPDEIRFAKEMLKTKYSAGDRAKEIESDWAQRK